MQYGSKLTVCISSNPATRIEKIKIFVDPTTQVDPLRQLCAASVLDLIEDTCRRHHVVDKGHKNSKGISETIFLISYGKEPKATCPRAGERRAEEVDVNSLMSPDGAACSSQVGSLPGVVDLATISAATHAVDSLVSGFDAQLREVFDDLLAAQQVNLCSTFQTFGLDLSDPQVRAFFALAGPRMQIEQNLHKLMEDVISSHPRLVPMVEYDRFSVLLQDALAENIPSMIDTVLSGFQVPNQDSD